MQELHEYVLVHRGVLESLRKRAERFDVLEGLLRRLISKEETMAAEQSAEARAMTEAVVGLEAEVADVTMVDAAIVVDLEGVKDALGKVNPTTPEQVNAVTAATNSLASLTAKLKAAGEAAAAVEAGAGEQSGGQQSPPAPTVSGISPAQGPPAGGGTVTISGANLQGASVAFGGQGAVADNVDVSDDGTSLTCIVPSLPGGTNVPVTVTTPAGSASTTYAYEAEPAAA